MVPEHVLVVGAGCVGGTAATLLASAGARVTAVRRSVVPDAEGVAWTAADVLTTEGLASLPDDADVVVVTLSPGARDVDTYRRVHVDVPMAVLAHQRRPPRRLLLTTSTAVYDTDDGSWVDESTPVAPPTPTAMVLREAELAIAEHVAAGLVGDATALRLGGIYGPDRLGLVERVRRGEATCEPGRWGNRIHQHDAAAAVAHFARISSTPPPVVNVVDDAPSDQCEVLRWLADLVGAPVPRVRTKADPAPRRPVTNKRVSNALARRQGWEPVHSAYASGYAASITSSQS